MNFTTVAMDMIVNHAAKLRFMSGGQTQVPIMIRTMTGAGFGTGGQHADYLEAWFAHTAGIKVVAPSSPAEAYGLMLSCIFDDDPCLFIENMPSYWNPGEAPVPGQRIPLGKARIVREGADVTVITYSRILQDCAAGGRAGSRRRASRSSWSTCARSRRWTRRRCCSRSARRGARWSCTRRCGRSASARRSPRCCTSSCSAS